MPSLRDHISKLLFILCFTATSYGFAFTQKYSVSLNTNYSTIIGRDNTYPNVNIASPLNYGVDFEFHYAEDHDFSNYIALSYRTLKYLNDEKNNIAIHNQGKAHDLGLKYDLYSKIFPGGRLITGVRYMNFYYFQSNPLGYIDVLSDMGMIARVGLDYVLYNHGPWVASATGTTGFSILHNMKNGYANELEARVIYKSSAGFNYLTAFTYSEFINKTDTSIATVESEQARVDLSFKLGLEKIF